MPNPEKANRQADRLPRSLISPTSSNPARSATGIWSVGRRSMLPAAGAHIQRRPAPCNFLSSRWPRLALPSLSSPDSTPVNGKKTITIIRWPDYLKITQRVYGQPQSAHCAVRNVVVPAGSAVLGHESPSTCCPRQLKEIDRWFRGKMRAAGMAKSEGPKCPIHGSFKAP
jgi:hypothetical protein